MSTATVDIDNEGVFKYVLIKLYSSGDQEELLVHGHAWAEYHDDVYQKVLEYAMSKGLDTECIG